MYVCTWLNVGKVLFRAYLVCSCAIRLKFIVSEASFEVVLYNGLWLFLCVENIRVILGIRSIAILTHLHDGH